MWTHVLWRFDGDKWSKIRPLDSDKYACCAKYECILAIGTTPIGNPDKD